mmetsp:Transcript_54027/g.80231  ORF Transcript_54027/g.80231 Transcript_54027/m.80231 type:complete len:132 (+) Transcript_54027:79-474(+)|eukprot:CAMPEP_0195523484 /NCGR_PEP_ID=MMETSP0794_2-20130614/22707_1 /TAXON_ID=515487 /ORGANISM="Stephanopyxis turris, Strain CCMP 815" /LENGTH=131 /DNA_ID=CAMNT_0040653495 /DNA_START=148 /DNA_END=543 /DNA_ORIENTATION=-
MFGNKSGPNYSQVPLNDGFSDSSDSDEDDFIQNEIRSQRQQLKEQDEGLEMLSQSAQRLGELSLNIHEELGQQNIMLDEMEQDLDKTSNNLDAVTNRTKELIKRSGGKKYFLIIVALTLVAIVLFFLVVYF